MIVCLILALVSPVSCGKEMTIIEKAENIMGLPVPLPEYLPEGYEIKSIDVEGDIEYSFWNIEIEIGDVKDSDNTSQHPISLGIDWDAHTFKTKTEKIAVGNTTIHVFRGTDYNNLVWYDRESRQLTLTADKEVELDELVRIAGSVTSPPRKVLEVSLESVKDLRILRGESRKFTLHIQNNSLETIRVSLVQYGELPEDIQVEIVDDAFSLKPGRARDIKVEIKVGQDAPSPELLRRSFSEVAPGPGETAWPYHALVDEPRYSLSIDCNYEIFGVSSRHERVSMGFYIDPEEILPVGMVSYREAENASDFLLHILLPQYLPESIDPPPIGYELGDEIPRSVTAYYKGLDVILNPEPGITEPTAGYTGERTIIRNKTVIISDNRIDWWVYDIHYTLISETVSMDELKIIAESMMTIDPHTRSWLGFGQ